jgi:hypothetical protein
MTVACSATMQKRLDQAAASGETPTAVGQVFREKPLVSSRLLELDEIEQPGRPSSARWQGMEYTDQHVSSSVVPSGI